MYKKKNKNITVEDPSIITSTLRADQDFAEDLARYLEDHIALYYYTKCKLIDWRFVNLPYTTGTFIVLKFEQNVATGYENTYAWFNIVEIEKTRYVKHCPSMHQFVLNEFVFTN